MSKLTHFKLKKTFLTCAILSSIPFATYADESDTMVVVGSIAKTGTVKFYDTESTDSINEKEISANASNKVDESLAYTSGVLTGSYGHGDRSNWVKIRGLDVSYTIDGMPQFTYGYFGSAPETFGLEKIEVLKGVNSELYGSSKPGGTVNMISKRPKDSPAGEVNVFYGNNSKIGINGDYSGVLTDDNSVRYRIVGQYRDNDGQQNYTGLKHYYFAPSLIWDVNDKTSLTLLANFQHDKGIPENSFFPGYGTLINTQYGKINRHTFYGEPNYSRFNRKVASVGYELRHQFDNGIVFTQNYKFSHQDLDIGGVYGSYTDKNRTYTRNSYRQIGIKNTHTIDNRLTKDFNFGKWRDTLLVGFDYLKNNMSGKDFNNYGDSKIDLFNPQYGFKVTENFDPFKLKAEELGLYIQNQLVYDNKLIFNQGVRHSKIKNSGYWSGSDFSRDYSHNSYNAGLMYIMPNGIAPYINYSESFLPVYGYNSSAKTIYRPYEAKQWEAGIKYEPEWMDGSITLAYFNIKSQNSFISNGTGNAGQALESRSKGMELQLQANLTDNIDIKLAYTHTRSETDKSATTTIPTPLVPRNFASGWVNYKFDGQLEGLTLGSGLRYIGITRDKTNFPNNTIPGYVIWDAMANYQISKNWSAQINVTNLTDKEYVAGCSYWCYYGAERSVVGTVTYRW